MTVYECMTGEETLSLFWRFESLHQTFTASGWPIYVFRPIVQIPALTMLDL
jgi:hypothetical protein